MPGRPVDPLLGTVATAAGPKAALNGVDGTELIFDCGTCRGAMLGVGPRGGKFSLKLG